MKFKEYSNMFDMVSDKGDEIIENLPYCNTIGEAHNYVDCCIDAYEAIVVGHLLNHSKRFADDYGLSGQKRQKLRHNLVQVCITPKDKRKELSLIYKQLFLASFIPSILRSSKNVNK